MTSNGKSPLTFNKVSPIDWIKIMGWSLLQLIIVLGSMWGFNNRLEHRLTTVEVQQKMILKMFDLKLHSLTQRE